MSINTLFRFKTTRSPQLIKLADKKKYYIERKVGTSIITRNEITNAIEIVDGFAPTYKTLDELTKKYSSIYSFASWLAKNKGALTSEKLNAEGREKLSPKSFTSTFLSETEEEKLWNDLEYYSFTQQEDALLSDAIISLLIAKYFVEKTRKEGTVEDTNELRKLAKSTVLINVKPTNPPEVVSNGEAVNIDSSLEFEKMVSSNEATIEKEKNQTLLKNVNAIKDIYQRKEAELKAAYDLNFKAENKAVSDRATLLERRIEENEADQAAIEELDNLEYPEYNYKPTSEIDFIKTSTILKEEEKAQLISYIDSNNFTSFNEIINSLSSKILVNEKTILENATPPPSSVSVAGNIITNADTSPKLRVVLNSVQQTNGIVVTPRVYMILPENLSITNMSFTLINTDGQTETTKDNFSFLNYENTSKVYQVEPFSFSSSTTVSVKGSLVLSNGNSFEFVGPNIDVPNNNDSVVVELKSLNNELPEKKSTVNKGIQRLGIMDYRKVEQEVCSYVPGEVSHIENIMAREFKQKSTRKLKRQENETVFNSERDSESLVETSSNSRFELNQEVASVISQNQSFAASAGVSGGSGIEYFANASYANNTSKENSNSQAVSIAKEITEAALERVVLKVKEQRTLRVLEEFEENSEHGYDNRKGDSHVSGVYRWVDKIYKNHVVNYGKRLIYEFMIPEPAKFHMLASVLQIDNVTQPLDPRVTSRLISSRNKISKPSDINATNAMYWAGVYNVSITPQPKITLIVSKAFEKTDLLFAGTDDGKIQTITLKDKIEIPEGYTARSFRYKVDFYAYTIKKRRRTEGFNGTVYFSISIGDKNYDFQERDFQDKTHRIMYVEDSGSFNNGIIESVPFSVMAAEGPITAGTITVSCNRSEELLKKWQIETFNAIIDGYKKSKEAYDEKMSEISTLEEERVKINPNYYRNLEKDVLRKNCISYLIGHKNMGKNFYIPYNSQTAENIFINSKDPKLDEYTTTAKFFEQAFEWDIMSYNFYPFYWAHNYGTNWSDKYKMQDNDPLFMAFLQSGMARVNVTVRPGFEEMVNWFFATGEIWNGGQVPTINDPEFISIVEELKEPESVVEETWLTRVPTDLTIIQAGSIGLNLKGLPYNKGCLQTLFDSDADVENPIVQTKSLMAGGADSGDSSTGGDNGDLSKILGFPFNTKLPTNTEIVANRSGDKFKFKITDSKNPNLFLHSSKVYDSEEAVKIGVNYTIFTFLSSANQFTTSKDGVYVSLLLRDPKDKSDLAFHRNSDPKSGFNNYSIKILLHNMLADIVKESYDIDVEKRQIGM